MFVWLAHNMNCMSYLTFLKCSFFTCHMAITGMLIMCLKYSVHYSINVIYHSFIISTTIIIIALILLWLWTFGNQFPNPILMLSRPMSVYNYTDLHITFNFSQTHWNVASSSIIYRVERKKLDQLCAHHCLRHLIFIHWFFTRTVLSRC